MRHRHANYSDLDIVQRQYLFSFLNRAHQMLVVATARNLDFYSKHSGELITYCIILVFSGRENKDFQHLDQPSSILTLNDGHSFPPQILLLSENHSSKLIMVLSVTNPPLRSVRFTALTLADLVSMFTSTPMTLILASSGI